ncbi:SDR family oxidoreductase [Corynebacterium sp. TAE3-ERU12]|uniref:SDR family oxidoreductase n=1 Tax=Corynebacterium sp. TAE3-ERU12 TaxID=2849491 RepID=UPI001C460D85|nr:SDR family oxidoreductase [Corynebacterium sp. TAE3-ERU12]MBV7294872.1 SDR family oxidoreductase [Corynebacterium sp. TAE3-ERU12]
MITYDFTSRTALITGGTRGIGRAAAVTLAKAGANIAITSRHDAAAHAAAAEIAADTGANVIGIGAHAGSEEAAEACCAEVVDTFGSLDVLVNNAGTNPAFGPLVKQSREALEKTFAINALAPVTWTGAAVRAGMGNNPGASVINIASIGALTVEDHLGAYDAAKSALLHITRQLSRELAPAIRVNAISPGVVRTKLSEALWRDHEQAVNSITPLGRIGEPGDVAQLIAFLASDAAGWITGENVVIDGGQLIGTPQPTPKK